MTETAPLSGLDMARSSLPSLLDARILLVDDDPGTIQWLSRVLAGYSHLRFATNGRDALRLAAEWSPELMLLDAEMPGLSGVEVLKAVQADPQLAAMPVIFVTQHSDAQTETTVFELGAADFITKPVTGPALRARVAMHLRLRRMTELLAGLQMRDGLTGLANRRQLDRQLAVEWARAQRSGQALTLMLLDIDHFGAFNQSRGAAQGDSCLRSIATLIQTLLQRPADLGARLDADAFALLLPETDATGAAELARRLAAGIQSLQWGHPASPAGGHVTASVGAAVLVERSPAMAVMGSGAESLMAEAIAAVDAARAAGHDRWVLRRIESAAAPASVAVPGLPSPPPEPQP